jgi:hypothetical protein
LKEKVYKECPIKIMHGKPLSGKMIGGLLEQYIIAINEGAVPNISAAWDNVMNLEIRKAYESAERTYKEKIQKIEGLPEEQDVLVTKLLVLIIYVIHYRIIKLNLKQ